MTQWKESLIFLALIVIGSIFSGWVGAFGTLSGWVAHLGSRRLLLRCCFSGSIEGLPQRLRFNAAVRMLLLTVVLGASANIKLSALVWAVMALSLGYILWMHTLWRNLAISSETENLSYRKCVSGSEGGTKQ